MEDPSLCWFSPRINHIYGSSEPPTERLSLCYKRLDRIRLHLFRRIKPSPLRPSSHAGVKLVLKTFRSVPEVWNVHLNLERFCNGACGPERAESFRNSQGANRLKDYTCGTLPTTSHTRFFLSLFIPLLWSRSLRPAMTRSSWSFCVCAVQELVRFQL